MRSNEKAMLDMAKYQVAEKIKNTWIETGGLIPTYLAAMMLNVSMPRINQIWKERKFIKYSFEDKKRDLLSFKDVLKILEERRKIFKQYTWQDGENGIIIEAKVLEKKSTTSQEAAEQTIEALKDLISALQHELEH